MRRRSLITFVVLNVLISLGVAFAVISVLNPGQSSSQQVVITVPILVTATTDPNATIPVRIITATPPPGSVAAGALPTGIFEAPDLTSNPAPTIDPELLSVDVALQGTATALPQNCILHTVKEGDTPFAIAEQYGADGFALMEVNGLDDVAASQLQIGDTLIVPLEGCSLTAADVVVDEEVTEGAAATAEAAALLAADEGEGEATEEGEAASTPRPTLTLPPTAASAQLEILRVRDAGDVTAEGVEIRNNGDTVNIEGWTLSDSDGNTFTFPEQLLFSNAQITVYTRTGRNTAIAFYWGESGAIWESGDIVTLTDDEGVVQSTLRIP